MVNDDDIAATRQHVFFDQQELGKEERNWNGLTTEKWLFCLWDSEFYGHFIDRNIYSPFFCLIFDSFKSTHWLDSSDIIKSVYKIPVFSHLLFRLTSLNVLSGGNCDFNIKSLTFGIKYIIKFQQLTVSLLRIIIRALEHFHEMELFMAYP